MPDPKKATARGQTNATTAEGWTADEKAAMQERNRELKAAARRGASKADQEQDALAKIAALPEPDRGMATRIHALVTANAPDLSPRTWYGMPAYANADGKIVCFFQPASKFEARYASFAFNDTAHLDDGPMWPVAFALTKLTAADEARIGALVKKAVR